MVNVRLRPTPYWMLAEVASPGTSNPIIRDFFGVGQVSIRKSNSAPSFYVTKISDLSTVILPHFLDFPLQSQKRVDFEI